MQKSSTTFLRYAFALLFAASFFGYSSASAQRTEINDGTEFHFGIPHCKRPAGEGARGLAPIQLWISSKVKTRINVKAESVGMNQPYTVEKDIVKVIPLPNALEMTESEVVRNYGVSVTSEAPISVTVFVSYRVSGEAFKVIPVEALGKQYYTLNMYQDSTNEYKPGQILIVATADNTVVTYTPSVHTNRVTAGGTGTVQLKKGDVFLIESKIQKGYNQAKQTDLTGTFIKSNKPIAVYSGHTKGAFPRYNPTMLGTPANFMRNMLIDAMWPVEFLGKEYVSAPVKYNNRPYSASDPDQRGDLIRFVATVNNTQIYQMRSDGSGLRPIGFKLNKGQYYDIVEQEDAAYYKADHPVLVGQYGKAWRSSNVTLADKGDNGDTPLNPSRNGEGMLMTLTPMEQWGSFAVFRSIEEIDNFTLIVFRSDQADSIKFDGQPLRMAFNGLLKVEGTPYSYARKQISAGDHKFEGTSNRIKFAAYAYGNYDNTKDGFAYGYPTSVNYAIACDDSLAVKAEPICGDFTGKAKALPSNAECASLYNAYMIADQSFNYTFELTTALEPGLKELDFAAKVIDKTKDAKAVVKIIMRSGRDTTITLEYFAQQVIAEPGTIDFGTLAPNGKKCGDLTLKNIGKVDAIINDLRFKNNGSNYTVDKSLLPITIKPGETATVEVCATSVVGMSRQDSVIAVLECYEKGVALVRYSTSTAKIHISDAEFDKVLIGHDAMEEVTISNIGLSRVEVYSVDIPTTIPFKVKDNKLQEDLAKGPIILESPGDTYTFKVIYTPVLDKDGNPEVNSFTAQFNANTEDVKTTSLWSGEGIDVIPVGSDRSLGPNRVIDEYVRTKMNKTEWPGTVSFEAKWKNAVITIKDIKIIDDTRNGFRLDANEIQKIVAAKTQLNPTTNSYQKVDFFFAPLEEGLYTAKVVMIGETSDDYGNFEERNDTVLIDGIGIQPNYTAGDKDWGVVPMGSPTPGNVILNSTGTTEIKIFSINIEGPDAANFKLDPSFNNGQPITEATPLAIKEGEEFSLPLLFTATRVGNFNARIVYTSDKPNPQPVSLLKGRAESQDIATTPYDFPATYISQTNTSGVVECINKNTADAIEVTAVNFNGDADDARFAITGYRLKNAGTTFTTLPITIPGNDALQVLVNFTPDAVRNNYAAQVNYTTSLGEVSSAITGIGKDMTSKVFIARNYSTSVGGNTQVAFELQGAPDAIADGNITSFKATISYNPLLVQARGGKDNIKLQDMLNGWEVVSAENDVKNGILQVVVQTNDPSKALKGEGSLFEFTLDGYLDSEKETEMPCSMTEYNRPWVNIQNSPGLITVDPVCGGDIRMISLSSTQYQLMVPAPNPVSGPVAVIQYSIGLESHTRLTLVDAQGQVISTLVNEHQKPGMYQVGVDVSGLANGKYFYQIQSGPFVQTQHMMISK
ncbi:MAG TPA: T9SS type A sorting domain-containing protein [Patescibacteria group bacterium]|nr:T9SS type A sorting domain-containing protein [Patescibacteria group bacterium]